MAKSKSAPVVVKIQADWENALADGIDEAIALLSREMGSVAVTTTPILAATALGSGIGRRVYGTQTYGVLVTVTESS